MLVQCERMIGLMPQSNQWLFKCVVSLMLRLAVVVEVLKLAEHQLLIALFIAFVGPYMTSMICLFLLMSK
jgi:hypothetical protein